MLEAESIKMCIREREREKGRERDKREMKFLQRNLTRNWACGINKNAFS